jgi:hypothetical protein
MSTKAGKTASTVVRSHSDSKTEKHRSAMYPVSDGAMSALGQKPSFSPDQAYVCFAPKAVIQA